MTLFRAAMVHTVLFEGHLASNWLEMGLIQCGVSWISSLAPTSRILENSPSYNPKRAVCSTYLEKEDS